MEDRGFIGVNARLAPHLLPPGWVSHAVNCRFRAGVAETRRGAALVAWAHRHGGSEEEKFPLRYGPLQGLGQFRDSASKSTWLIVAADGQVWRSRPGNAPVLMALPAGETLPERVSFTQAGQHLIMHRGFDRPALRLPALNRPWEAVPEPIPGTGTVGMPQVEQSLYFAGRLWAVRPDDTVWVSDFNDPFSYVPALQQLYINPGSSDRIVALAPVGRSTVVVFKERSVVALYHAYGDLSALEASVLTTDFGCVAAESVVNVGGELWFLSQDGVRSLLVPPEGQQGLVQLKMRRNERGEDVPLVVSDDIEPLLRRIHGAYAGRCAGAYWDRKFYLAAPLDGHTANNVIFVYDFVNGAWAGYDEAASIKPERFAVFHEGGRAMLLVYGQDGIIREYEAPGHFFDMHYGPFVELRPAINPEAQPNVNRQFRINQGPWILVDMEAEENADGPGYLRWGQGQAQAAPGDEAWASRAAQNLFIDANGVGGFSNQRLRTHRLAWPAPNTEAMLVRYIFPPYLGVRLWSTNGEPVSFEAVPEDDSLIEVTSIPGWWRMAPILMELNTRGYSLDDGNLGADIRLQMDAETWAAHVLSDVVTSGAHEIYTMPERKPNRTRWLQPAGRPPFYWWGHYGRPYDPHREDYSLAFADDEQPTVWVRLPVTLETCQTYRWDVRFMEQKDSQGEVRSPRQWLWAMVRLMCVRGRMRLLGLKLETTPGGTLAGANA